ncbi:MAG: VTT domain-containing protein, partial [Verrucomicrobiota bacterium]
MTEHSKKSEPGNPAKHTRTFWIVSIACVAICIVVFAFIDTKALHTWAKGVDGWLVFSFMAFLPLIGVPVSFLYIIGGARFGTIGGLIAAAFAITINLLLTYWLTKTVLHKPIAAFFKKTKYNMPQVPEGEYVSVTLLTALVPGLPYTAKNYLLVLAGVPFRIFFWVCLPAHFVHATLGILFGDMTNDLTKGKNIFLIIYGIV